ncbi:hypothetical protein PUNSTDRAFT_88830 [Punctularia strigosozonata HHB-11173 SS5]|uniref:uncharacterized protein n=1 Tax=Punctularia strigosozonata (strain HHB-11173) TaxID=741275 RepID=UPI0004416D21|nr:uncharacterized protein PUNSTDRAFT_88830 [Punctularia strigosozonata HHB-11173 SS5]EIN08043.1 hypothetical protein PUNSTDRAFT_88830 [Punctularia strigosozonata HHB-11173 SS5]
MLVSVPQNPQRPTSMTMQHALAGLYTPPPAQPSSDLRPLPGHPKPQRRNSTPSSPATSIAGSASGNTVQCSGQTKAGRRCTRQVKIPMSVARLDEDEDEAVEIFCFQHSKELMGQSGFYARQNGEWVEYKDWIPNYLSQDTQVALRIEMEKARSLSDQAGYIYTFEIRDKKTPSHIHLKVGRAVNLTKRIDEWGKQCKSKEPILRGWWPGSVEEDNSSLLKGRVKAGDKGPCCHRLERLVHLELTDLTLNKPYLHPNFPNQAPTPGNGRTNSNSTASGKKADARCEDCGQRHKEIFTFERPQIGPYVGKEWEKLVLPVIEKWGGFVRAYV